MNTPRLFARPQTEGSGWNSELALRYGAATLVTLIALAAAQLVLPTRFVLILGAITLLGVPVSLWMRLHQLCIGGVTVPRPLWNALTVMTSAAASALLLRVPLRNISAALQGGLSETTLSSMSASEPMLLLIQLFLVFAAFRSFSIISDKDATLTTVPSFSVLLLLIPVYPNIEVVCYFLVWTLVATMLFALDHRSEVYAQVTATVPAPAPGQEVKLAARSLAGVLTFSLTVAVALSGLLTARDPREGSSSDSAIALLAGRLTSLALQSQDNSATNGPERQIDFSAGTSLPTRAPLWSTRAETQDGKTITPAYWRLLTLSDYNGSAWTQSISNLSLVERTPLNRQSWPNRREGSSYREGFEGTRPTENNSNNSNNRERDSTTSRAGNNRNSRFNNDQGFDLSKAQPKLSNNFGHPGTRVQYRLTSLRASLGFVPLLPAPTQLFLPNSDQNIIRLRADGSVDMSVVELNQVIRATSRVPMLPEYGFAGKNPPLEQNADAPADAPQLSRAERVANLRLPAKLPARVRQFARNATRAIKANSSNYARAQLLARATQNGAIYTLRPPTIPPERDATDFFLFESRRGYCTYFAGALTVLCRAQGIPARVVSGFVAPDEEGAGENVIRDANAHAWTEVWVENWGWAVVDATPSDDRGDNAPTFLENWSDLTAAHLDTTFRWSATHWPQLLVAGGCVLMVFLCWRFRRVIAHRLGRDNAEDVEALRRQISADYARATRQLARRFRPRQAWETPDEWLRAARIEVPQLPIEPLQTLTSLYVRARFSPHELPSDAPQKARDARERVVWAKGK